MHPIVSLALTLVFSIFICTAQGASNLEVLFSEPSSQLIGYSKDRTIALKIANLISQATARSEIRASLYQFDDVDGDLITSALHKAYERGVDIAIVLDDSSNERKYSHARDRLIRILGKDQVHVCSRPACVGSNNNHNKFFIFSELAQPSIPTQLQENVIAQFSANLSDGQTRKFNDLVVIDSDEKLFEAYKTYWLHLWNENHSPDYMSSSYGQVSGNGATDVTAYFLPSLTDDPALDLLNDTSCEQGGAIHLAHSKFKGDRAYKILRRLQYLRTRGCQVSLLLRPGSSDNNWVEELSASGLNVRYIGGIWGLMHTKYIVVDAQQTTAAGERKRFKTVMTGSSNLSEHSLRENDEVILRLRDDKAYEQYLLNWHKMHAFSR